MILKRQTVEYTCYVYNKTLYILRLFVLLPRAGKNRSKGIRSFADIYEFASRRSRLVRTGLVVYVKKKKYLALHLAQRIVFILLRYGKRKIITFYSARSASTTVFNTEQTKRGGTVEIPTVNRTRTKIRTNSALRRTPKSRPLGSAVVSARIDISVARHARPYTHVST